MVYSKQLPCKPGVTGWIPSFSSLYDETFKLSSYGISCWSPGMLKCKHISCSCSQLDARGYTGANNLKQLSKRVFVLFFLKNTSSLI